MGCFGGCGNDSCLWIIVLIILISCCCNNNNNGCGNARSGWGNDCGCGCGVPASSNGCCCD